MIFETCLRRDFLIVFLIGLSLNGSCSVVMIGVFVLFPASRANLPLAGFQTWMWRRSIFSSFMMLLSCFSWDGSFLCFISKRITRMSSFSRLATQLSRVGDGPQQTIGLNFSRSRNLASRYI